MKLIVCDECHDVVGLRFDWRVCECRKSGGRYLDDGLTIRVGGPCHVLGIDNKVRFGYQDRGEVFLIPEPHERIIRVVPVGVTDGSNPEVQD